MPTNEACQPPGTAGTIARPARPGPVARLRLAASAIDPASLGGIDLDLIAMGSRSFPQIRWTDTSSGDRWLGLGAADDLVAQDSDEAWALATQCRKRLGGIRASAGARSLLRYFGGIAFDPLDEPHPEWVSGGRGRFVLPRILLRQSDGGNCTQGIMIFPAEEGSAGDSAKDRVESEIAQLVSPSGHPSLVPDLPSLTGVPIAGERERWIDSIRLALGAIERGRIRKVVLSRDFRLCSKEVIEPAALLGRIEPRLAHGHLFCFRFDPEAAFLGATPERLVSLTGSMMQCDCLAGTGPGGRAGREDDAMADLLLQSEKDSREHRFVRDGIVTSLEAVARWIDVEKRPTILRLSGLHHLSTSIRGSLREGVAIGELLRRLHPTPAVGGSPRDEALGMIRRLEGRPRGWYAGPVGWVGLDQADFVVGIRAGIVRGRTLRAFAGAGIVSGSDPDAEWDETARKAASFLNLFTEALP